MSTPTVDLSTLPLATALDGSEKLPGLQAGAAVAITVDEVTAHTVTAGVDSRGAPAFNYPQVPGTLFESSAVWNFPYSRYRHTNTYPAVGGPDSNYGKFQISVNFGDNSADVRMLLDHFQWGNTRQGLNQSWVRSRGDGIPGSSTYYRKSYQSDSLLKWLFYGSSDFNAAHAAYMEILADYDSLNDNELAGFWSFKTSNALTRGNGIAINSLSQVVAMGPTVSEPPPGTNFGAHFSIGPGESGPGRAPLKLWPIYPARDRATSNSGTPGSHYNDATPAVLLAVPEPGAIEVDSDGVFYLTDQAGRRGPIPTHTQIIYASAVKKPCPVSDGTVQTVASFTIPANSMGPNGWVEVEALLSCTASANEKDFYIQAAAAPIRLGVFNISDPTLAALDTKSRWMNRNATNSQVACGGKLNGTSSSGNVLLGTLDTTVNQVINLMLRVFTAGETAAIESCIARVVYRP